MTTVVPVLPQGAGYGVVIGIGFFFALAMCGITFLQNRYTQYSTKQSEEFNTASRSVKSGLIASSIVSAWTWAATLLQASTVAYEFGVSGPFWVNAAGATVQIFMFAVLACKVKQNAPRCHTFLEIIYYRYGKVAHSIFICFALITNILVASQLLLGGSAVVTALTGMNTYAANILIPLGVCLYVVLGGLRATFLCDYSHTVILLIIILYFMFSVYTTNPLIGSPEAMYELLEKASRIRPVSGNTNGSYLTLKSNSGLIFAAIEICDGFGTVFLDQGYWQRAIASRPTTAVRAYILGGMAWFAIPFGFATTLGLAAVALTDSPSFPTYPEAMTASQISSGLSAPFAAVALLGTGGSIAILLTLFMAVTSSASSELIAVSSILTFDIYKIYWKPSSTPEELIKVSHIMICLFAIVMAGFACLWNGIGIDLGWLFYVMGLLIGGAVFPAAFTICWKGQTKAGLICGSLGGLVLGVIAWLTTARVYFGELTIATTGAGYSAMAGCLTSVMMGLILSVVISLIKPDNFDWEITRRINAPLSESVNEGISPNLAHQLPTMQQEDKQAMEDAAIMEDPKMLRGAYKLALICAIILTLIMIIIIPVPMFLSHYIYSLAFFKLYIAISFIWVFFALGTCAVLPVYEAVPFFKTFFLESRAGSRKPDISIGTSVCENDVLSNTIITVKGDTLGK